MKTGKKNKGFTLIEVLIILTIVSIIALTIRPSYQNTIIRSKEAALKKNLYLIREALDNYYLDHVDENNQNYYPSSLSDLSNGKFKYLRYIPEDPFTEKEDWTLILDQSEKGTGIYDIKSSSEKEALDGSKYNQW